MVPSDFRLPNIASGLISRLEGTRRSYVADAEAGEAKYREIAREQVAAALQELEELDYDVQGHRALLESEIFQTFLPRYARLASSMNTAEQNHFGLGPLGEPLGRVALVGVALCSLAILTRLIYLPWAWPLMLIDLSLPLWPDILSALHRRRYRTELQAIVDDLDAIQHQASHFAAAPSSEARPTSRPLRETQ